MYPFNPARFCRSGLLLAFTVLPGKALEPSTGPFPLAEAVAFQNVVLSDKAAVVKDWTVTFGAMSTRFSEGTASYLLVNGKPAGVFVKGSGSFRFLANDPVMMPTLLFNLEQNTALVAKPEGSNLVLGEPISQAIFWFAGKPVPQLEEMTQPSLAKDYKVTSDLFAQRDQAVWASAPRLLNRPPTGHLMAYRALNGTDAPVVSAELVGATENWVYTYDAAFAGTESLFLQPSVVDSGISRTVVLAATPIGWVPSAPPDPDYRLAHIDLDLVASKGMQGQLKLVETIQVIRPTLRCLQFHFSHLRNGKASFGREAVVEAFVRHVRTESGADLRFDLRGGFLEVDLGRTAKNGETLKLSFEIDGALLDNESDSEFSYWRLTPGRHWFPEPVLAGQSYTVKAKVAVEKPFVPIASAKTISRSSSTTHNLLEAGLDKPTLWFSVAAGDYKPVELVRNNRTVRAWCYSGVSLSSEALLKTTHGILDFYDHLLGGVPFDEINLVEVPYLGFGQAPAGMIWLTKEAFNPMQDLETRIVAGYGAVGGWANRLLAHELAHQYWCHRVKIWSQADNWISEAFAEYTSSLAIRAMKKKGPPVFENIIRDWGIRATQAAPHGTIPTAQYMQPNQLNHSSDPQSRQYPRAILYYKGAYLLACLHRDMGEEAFLRFLRGYQQSFKWYPPSFTQDVPDQLKAATERDYDQWMKNYFWGTGMPQWKPW